MESSTESRTPPGSDSSMANLQKRSRVVNSAVDRISDLPDSVICHILSFFPTKRAVATSILGRRWKLLWTKVTVLDFEGEDDVGRPSPNNEEEGDERMTFVQFVNKVLIQHEARHLEKLRINSKKLPRFDAVYANVWINYAIARKVRVLDLLLDHPGVGESLIHVPSTLFTCVSLEFLRLDGFVAVNIPSVVCLPKLEVLIIWLYRFGWTESLQQLISACPVLHFLKILRCEIATLPSFKVSSNSLRRLEMRLSDEVGEFTYEGKVEIDAPNLKFLSVEDYIYEELSVKWLPSVDTVKLDLHVYPKHEADLVAPYTYTDHCNSFVKLIEALTRVNFLTLHGTIMEALSSATIPLSACFERLTKLDIHCHCCQWSSLNLMLDYSIKLEVLNITLMPIMTTNKPCSQDPHKECWKDPKQVPICLLGSLTHIFFRGFMGLEDQMAMMRYILNHGMVLKSIIVQSGDCGRYGNLQLPCDVNGKFEMLQKIAMFPRCSPICEIKFD